MNARQQQQKVIPSGWAQALAQPKNTFNRNLHFWNAQYF